MCDLNRQIVCFLISTICTCSIPFESVKVNLALEINNVNHFDLLFDSMKTDTVPLAQFYFRKRLSMFTKEQKKLLFLSSVGGILEFYDFVIYALLATSIAANFFPSSNVNISLIATFATFSVGYLARPLGGILFGHFGDKRGRKTTFTSSILMMAIATLGIALIPSYQSIGVAAPILVTLLRIIQGISVGGEIPGAIAYISESIPERKGFAAGIVFGALISGITLGSLIQAILNNILGHEVMFQWGWRIPFILGGLLGFMSYFLRKQLQESYLFKTVEDKIESFPLAKAFREHFLNILAGIFIVGLGASIITLLFLFIPAYLTKVLHLPSSFYIWPNTIAIFAAALICIGFSKFADKFDIKYLMMLISLATLVLAYPIFLIYSKYTAFYLVSFAISALLTGTVWGTIPTVLSEAFPTRVRYTGIAISYNMGFAIFGGLTPLFSMLLIYKTGSVLSPAIYLVIVSVCSLIALGFIKLLWLKRGTASHQTPFRFKLAGF